MSGTTRNVHRIGGAVAKLAADALAGTCGIGGCPEPSVGYIQGASNRPVGVCEGHVFGALERGYVVHREAPAKSGR